MRGKIKFGFDYLVLMRNLQWKGRSSSDGLDPVDDAAARLFLLEWGFTNQEVDETNKIFWERARANALPTDLLPVAQRVTEYLKGDRNAQERLIIQLAAVGSMDGIVTPDEGLFVLWFRDLFDLKPSEWEALANRGEELAVGLNFFGKTFASNRGARSPFHPSS